MCDRKRSIRPSQGRDTTFGAWFSGCFGALTVPDAQPPARVWRPSIVCKVARWLSCSMGKLYRRSRVRLVSMHQTMKIDTSSSPAWRRYKRVGAADCSAGLVGLWVRREGGNESLVKLHTAQPVDRLAPLSNTESVVMFAGYAQNTACWLALEHLGVFGR